MSEFSPPQFSKYSPNELVARFEGSKIQINDPIFQELYPIGSLAHDRQSTENLRAKFGNNVSVEDRMGPIGEAVVFDRIQEGKIFGSGVSARGATTHDDYFKGADIVLDADGFQEPTIATVDVTLNQRDIKGITRQPHFASEENNRPVGLEQKLSRIKRHIDEIARVDPNYARDWSAWLRGGGMHETRNTNNLDYFKMAEKALLLKYYVSPDTSEDPHQPRYVLGGPQVVLSLDVPFVNKILTDGDHQSQHEEAIDAVLQVEMGYGITALQQYLSKIVNQSRNRNLIFDTHFASTKAWADKFNSPEQRALFERALSTARSNPEVGKQIGYYMETWNAAFR